MRVLACLLENFNFFFQSFVLSFLDTCSKNFCVLLARRIQISKIIQWACYSFIALIKEYDPLRSHNLLEAEILFFLVCLSWFP